MGHPFGIHWRDIKKFLKGVFSFQAFFKSRLHCFHSIFCLHPHPQSAFFNGVSTASPFNNGCGTFNSINRYILIYVYYDRKRINYLLKVKKVYYYFD